MALSPRQRWVLVWLIGVPVAAIIGVAFTLTRRENRVPVDAKHVQDGGSFPANAAPDVKYVGDESCAQCHQEIAQAYHRHPMAQSFAPIGTVQPPTGKVNHFEKDGFRFLIESQTGKSVHAASRLDVKGETVYHSEAPISFVVGAGIRGQSFLVDRQGYLFQSPISWYAERNAWDLSPHLGDSLTQLYRPVQPLCLYCHANRVDHVEGSGNHYRGSLFSGQGIGCERCHGPGKLHVERHKQDEVVALEDEAIVNPGRLSPELREAVCQQCHLQGLVRILRPNRQLSDYRPGLSPGDFWSIFVKPAVWDQQKKFSSEVEQMYASRCFRESRGRLGCISCHDPHETPTKEQKTKYYRDRCLACHQENACGLQVAERRKQNAGDNCIACHMMSRPSSLPHMASADHRIPRRSEAADQEASVTSSQWLTELERSPEGALVLFPENQSRDESNQRSELSNRDSSANGRDFGLALMDLASLKVPSSVRRRLAEHALPLLSSNLESCPDDVPARQGQGYAFWLLDRKAEALAAFEKALDAAPEREEVLAYAAAVAAQSGQTELAIKFWRRALDVNPWSPRSHHELAKLLAHDHQWKEAFGQVEKSLDLDPFQVESHLLKIECHLELGQTEQAGKEFNDLLRPNPEKAPTLRRWFEERKARTGINDR
jgi:predicted CXXCH cytochrome family protein